VLFGAALNAEIEHQTARDSTIGHPKPTGRPRRGDGRYFGCCPLIRPAADAAISAYRIIRAMILAIFLARVKAGHFSKRLGDSTIRAKRRGGNSLFTAIAGLTLYILLIRP
jgi:hypothetical protein